MLTPRSVLTSNIFLTRGQVKLLDFGLAKITTEKAKFASSAAGGCTVSWDPVSSPDSVNGTVGYMSPEQALGKQAIPGAICSPSERCSPSWPPEFVPFAGTSAAVFDALLNKHPVSPLHLHPVLPEELDNIIRKALERDR
jgi:serine/threonine protein kinase